MSVDATVELSTAQTVNALRLTGNFVSISGAGTLRITSGTLLSTPVTQIGPDPSGVISPSLDFGAAEATIFAGSFLSLGGKVSGSGGLTKSGTDDVGLYAANDFTGPLTINSGYVWFRSMGNLGADTSPVRIAANVNGAGLRYGVNLPLVFDRGIEILRGYGVLNPTWSGWLDATGTISGEGGLKVLGALILDNSATVVGDRLPDASPMSMGSGSFMLLGNSALPVRETIANPPSGGGSELSVILTAPGAASTILEADTAPAAGQAYPLIVRGDRLGGTAGGSTLLAQSGAAGVITGGRLIAGNHLTIVGRGDLTLRRTLRASGFGGFLYVMEGTLRLPRP